MTRVITGAGASANFFSGLTCPTPGEPGTQWWNEYEGMFQELANESQWAFGWYNGGTPFLRVPIVTSTQNASSRFSFSSNSGFASWVQGNVTDAGLLSFPVTGNLPVGRTIAGVVATVKNPSTTNVSIGTKARIELAKFTLGGSISSLGHVNDPTNVLATYQSDHDFTLSLTETISSGAEYLINFQGETGANSTTGLTLERIYLILDY